MNTRHGTSNPGQLPSKYRSVRCHPAYRNKTQPTPEEARERNARSKQYRQWMQEARGE